MRRIVFILFTVMTAAVCSASTDAMSNSKMRKETRFLTDKMAYELNLNTEQYNDVYEINYDFISGINYVMEDVLIGQEWALNRYYDYLDIRNDDLHWVLDSRQYNLFMQAEYFYRPIYTSGNNWLFRVYIRYTNHNQFYFPRPYNYRTYVGGHYRTHNNNTSYYRGRYQHSYYTGSYGIRNNNTYTTTRRSDFGSVTVRPNTTRNPASDDVYTTRRSSSNNSTTDRVNTTRNTTGSGVSRTPATNSRDVNNSSNTNSSRRSTTTTAPSRESTPTTTVRSNSGSSRSSSSSSSSRSSSSTRSTRSSGSRR